MFMVHTHTIVNGLSAMGDHWSQPHAPIDRAFVPACDEPVGEHLMTMLGEDRLGMELHSLDRQLAMPQRHDHTGRSAAGDLNLVREGLLLDSQ